MIRNKLIPPLAVWALVVAASLLYWLAETDWTYMRLAEDRSRAFFKVIQTHRLWNALHGGVYVVVTEDTPPNPYLDDPRRDIVTVDGMNLTMINPAYMTRQIAELAASEHGLFFHITSLKPIRPGNSPDAWEIEALAEFEKGVTEKLDVTPFEGIRAYRYMAPLMVKAPCLKCHAKQGYREGDVRGGISVTIPMTTYAALKSRQKTNAVLAHIAAFALGSALIGLYVRRSARAEDGLRRALAERETLVREMNHRIKNNLSVVESLLSLQGRDIADEKSRGLLMESQSRVKSVSLLHQSLSNAEDLRRVNFKDYTASLARNIQGNFGQEAHNIAIRLDIPPVSFDVETMVPLGLIVTELLTNAFKYAFAGREHGTVTVALASHEDGSHELVVRDNGAGLPAGFDPNGSGSLGMLIILSLVEQLAGAVAFESSGGTAVTLRFRERGPA